MAIFLDLMIFKILEIICQCLGINKVIKLKVASILQKFTSRLFENEQIELNSGYPLIKNNESKIMNQK